MATISERLRDSAQQVDNDGTPSQIGMTPAELREAADTIDALVAALEFYADPKRYEGPNQKSEPGDPWGDHSIEPYRKDVTRDNGAIARAALARAKG